MTYVELLGGKGSSSNSGRVSLGDTNDLSNLLGRDTESGADTTDGRGGRGDVGVGTKVEVEHERVGTLDQDALVRLERFVHERHSVDDEGLQLLGEDLVGFRR